MVIQISYLVDFTSKGACFLFDSQTGTPIKFKGTLGLTPLQADTEQGKKRQNIFNDLVISSHISKLKTKVQRNPPSCPE